ncbi:MAG TPA: DUF3658 domain-containing protein [Gallionellaceae bacterium]|nr:DUF3658 domain-containing protein [Gallionellaceae bacterium]
MNSNDDDPPDGEMTSEEARIAASLSGEMVQKIDACLLSHAKIRERKVAMIVGLAMMDKSLRVPGLPDLFYRDRVKSLVARGLLLSEGNLDYMRYSEVRLPE